MGSFETRWRGSARKELRGLPPAEISRIVAAVEKLADEPFPHGSQKLTGSEHSYRIRLGDYRVIYEVLNSAKLVEIPRVRHRRDVYR